MSDKKSIFANITSDLARFAFVEGHDVSLKYGVTAFFLTPGFQLVSLIRLCQCVRRFPFVGWLLARTVRWLTQRLFSVKFLIDCPIGPGLYIPHPFNISLYASNIGRDVSIMQGVSVGRPQVASLLNPTLEDGVALSANAVILGPIRVGSYSVVGANAVVLNNVPDKSVAVGAPAKVLPSKAA